MRFKKSTISAIIILVALATIVVMSGLNFIIPTKTQNYTDNTQTNTEKSQRKSANMMVKIDFTTKDGVKIAADFYPAEKPGGWLVLIHMMPATKESWRDFAQRLQQQGYESIAIDLRGHGESILTEERGKGEEERLDYRSFSDEDHQKSILDLEAAVDYLIKNRGAAPEKISFIGASIGANLSLQYISEHPKYKTAVLLSPGLNYRGIKTEPLVKNLKTGQKVLFVSSRDDGSNAEENQQLYNSTPAGVIKDLVIYQAAGHGTNMFNKEKPDLTELIIKFIQ